MNDNDDDDITSTEQRDRTRGRMGMDNTPKVAAGIVIGSIVLLAILRGAFRGRAL